MHQLDEATQKSVAETVEKEREKLATPVVVEDHIKAAEPEEFEIIEESEVRLPLERNNSDEEDNILRKRIPLTNKDVESPDSCDSPTSPESPYQITMNKFEKQDESSIEIVSASEVDNQEKVQDYSTVNYFFAFLD